MPIYVKAKVDILFSPSYTKAFASLLIPISPQHWSASPCPTHGSEASICASSQAKDFTAIAIIEKPSGAKAIYHVRSLERTRGTSYPDVVTRVKGILNKPRAVLVVDQTGCFRPVFDMFEEAGLKPVGISIHGGDKATHEGNTWRVPKRDLVAVLQVLLQNQRLKIAPGPQSDILASEMLNFKVKIDPTTAHDSYSA